MRFNDHGNFQTPVKAILWVPFILLIAAVGMGAAQDCVEPPAGLVGWWPGDGNTDDIQGDNAGTLQNGATFADGLVGQAFSFDGANDKILIPNEATFDFTTEVAVDAWVFSAGAERNYQSIVNKGYFSGGPFELRMTRQAGPNPVELGCLNTHVVFFAVTTNNGLGAAKACLTKGVWHHVAGTYDGAAVRLYLDGELVMSPSGVMSETPHSGTLIQNDLPVSIGWDGVFGEHWSGLIDEVEIFDHAPSAADIEAIYLAGAAGKCKPPSVEDRIVALEAAVAALQEQVNALLPHIHSYLAGDGPGHNKTEALTGAAE